MRRRSQYSKYNLLSKNTRSIDLSNLKRDSFFTHDQLNFLQRLFTKFSDSLVPSLNPLISMKIKIDYESIENYKFGDLIDKISNPIIIVAFSINGEKKGLFLIDNYLGFSLLDRILGGKGESLTQTREFSELESRMFLNIVVKNFIETLIKTWKVVSDVNIEILDIYFSSHNAIVYSYSENITIVNFSVKWLNSEYIFRLVLPYTFIVNSLPKIKLSNLSTDSDNTKVNPTLVNIVKKRITESTVNIEVELGQSEVMFQDLLYLSAGDVITLDTKLDDLVKIKVSNEVRFYGKPVVYNKRMAVKIIKLAEEEEDDVGF